LAREPRQVARPRVLQKVPRPRPGPAPKPAAGTTPSTTSRSVRAPSAEAADRTSHKRQPPADAGLPQAKVGKKDLDPARFDSVAPLLGAASASEAMPPAVGPDVPPCAQRIHHDEIAQPRCKRCVPLDLGVLQ
jgi:hypothetical protein